MWRSSGEPCWGEEVEVWGAVRTNRDNCPPWPSARRSKHNWCLYSGTISATGNFAFQSISATDTVACGGLCSGLATGPLLSCATQ